MLKEYLFYLFITKWIQFIQLRNKALGVLQFTWNIWQTKKKNPISWWVGVRTVWRIRLLYINRASFLYRSKLLWLGKGESFNEDFQSKLVVKLLYHVFTCMSSRYIYNFWLPRISLLFHLWPSCVGTGPFWKYFLSLLLADTMYPTVVHEKSKVH